MVPSKLSQQVLDDARTGIDQLLSLLQLGGARVNASADAGMIPIPAENTDTIVTDGGATDAAAPPEEQPREAFIGPIFDRNQAREWALVLQSQSIGFVLVPRQGSYLLRVNPDDLDHAVAMIDLYEAENENWPPPRYQDKPRHDSSLAIPMAFVVLGLFYLYATGPVARGSVWFTHGRADALRLLSEPWRMVTALTLHADGQHIIGNTISGSIFGMMLARRIGPGGALLSMVVAGTLGNTINAVYHLPGGHRSIGASTAVFAAVGILAAVQTIIDWGKRTERQRYGLVDMAAPVIGGLTLLGMLGAGKGNTDVWAHGFGFGAGVLVGTVVALWMRKRNKTRSTLTQLAAFASCFALVGGAWALAIL